MKPSCCCSVSSLLVVAFTGALLLYPAVAAAAETEDSAITVVRSLADDLPFDSNGKLQSHQFVYTQGCATDAVPVPYGFEFSQVTGKAASDLFGSSDNNDECHAACIERGVDRALAAAVLPHKKYPVPTNNQIQSAPDESKRLQDFIHDACSRVEVCLMNYHDADEPLRLFWINTQGENKLHLTIEYGERKTRCFSSFLGHQFQAETASGEIVGTNTGLSIVTIEHTTVLAFGESPTLVQTPEQNAAELEATTKKIQNTLHNEWTRHNRVTRTFSPLGFAKGRLPDDVFASMGALYYNNRHHKQREEWKGKGVFVNWWEADCQFLPIPWGLKALWQTRLKDLVQAWAGVPIEQTDMYGLRQYEAGARLLTHVDREATHAVSLIVNVAQGNLTEPWPVEVHDHADRLHEVIMAPGDVVYYESAKCLHGRNRPLKGPNAYYVNLFTHYRPIGDDKWFEKPNHEGTPEAVLLQDVQGTCRLEPKGITGVPGVVDGQVGLVEAVTCDDPRLGSYVSPALFTATSGADLMEWWRQTGPGGGEGGHPVVATTESGSDGISSSTDEDEDAERREEL